MVHNLPKLTAIELIGFNESERQSIGFALSYLVDGHPEKAIETINRNITNTLLQNSFCKAVFRPEILQKFHSKTQIHLDLHGIYEFCKCNKSIQERPTSELDQAVFNFCSTYLKEIR